MSFIERSNVLCPLFGVSFKRGSTVAILLHTAILLHMRIYILFVNNWSHFKPFNSSYYPCVLVYTFRLNSLLSLPGVPCSCIIICDCCCCLRVCLTDFLFSL